MNQTIVYNLELIWHKWKQNELQRTYNVLLEYALSPKTAGESVVKLAYPESYALPCSYNGSLKRYGTTRDTGKFLCGLDKLSPETNNCIIYSLGSGGSFDFEESVLKQTQCQMYTFDCTSSQPKNPIHRLYFDKVCLGEASRLQEYLYPYANQPRKPSNMTVKPEDELLYKSLRQILRENNHTVVHVLKMDIEGGEYSVFVDLFTNNKVNLPYQIAFESHWWHRDIYHALLHQQMFAELWKNGYRFLQHEYNSFDRACVEWTLLRVYC
ncbi:unnamed protein product [Didymodactylos carnosus]|uniref:Methyltransferase domain-containing protein n=1 Tax=Didymodactylos carnosus TaxID=1234261 RepID=A0A814LA13_9BILA|nr:unnamed protein product [Didymodactylos carnosus]CAF3829744.1 unnamed protein product [Didymodactylos carnosus]